MNWFDKAIKVTRKHWIVTLLALTVMTNLPIAVLSVSILKLTEGLEEETK